MRAELQNGHLVLAARRMGANDCSELLLLLMNHLAAIFAEKPGLGLGLKARFD